MLHINLEHLSAHFFHAMAYIFHTLLYFYLHVCDIYLPHIHIKNYSGKMPSKYCFVWNCDKFRYASM